MAGAPPKPWMAIDPAALEHVKQMSKDLTADQFALQVQNLACLMGRENVMTENDGATHSAVTLDGIIYQATFGLGDLGTASMALRGLVKAGVLTLQAYSSSQLERSTHLSVFDGSTAHNFTRAVTAKKLGSFHDRHSDGHAELRVMIAKLSP